MQISRLCLVRGTDEGISDADDFYGGVSLLVTRRAAPHSTWHLFSRYLLTIDAEPSLVLLRYGTFTGALAADAIDGRTRMLFRH